MGRLAWALCSVLPLVASGCGLVLGVSPPAPDAGSSLNADAGVLPDGGPARDANAPANSGTGTGP